MTDGSATIAGDHSMASEPARLAVIAIVSLSVALLVAIGLGTITLVSLLTPGGLGPSADVIAHDFGVDAVRPELTGYDGQQAYAIRRDFPHLDQVSENLDAPAYRLLRVLPAALASLAPPGNPTVVAMLALNIAGFGLAVYGGARLLDQVGGRTAFALPAAAVLLLGVATTTDGPVTWGACVAGMAFAVDGRHRVAVGILVVAALSRESASIAALCVGTGVWLRGVPLRRAATYGLPALAAGAWYLVLTQLVDPGIPARADPLGFLALEGGGALVALGTFVLGLYAAYRWRDLPGVALDALAYTSWMAVYTPAILDPLALLRVNALPILLGVLAIGRPPHAPHAYLRSVVAKT